MPLPHGAEEDSLVDGESDVETHTDFVLLCFAIGALLVCYHYYAGEACGGPGEGLCGRTGVNLHSYNE